MVHFKRQINKKAPTRACGVKKKSLPFPLWWKLAGFSPTNISWVFTMCQALFNAKNEVLKKANWVPVQSDSIPSEGRLVINM